MEKFSLCVGCYVRVAKYKVVKSSLILLLRLKCIDVEAKYNYILLFETTYVYSCKNREFFVTKHEIYLNKDKVMHNFIYYYNFIRIQSASAINMHGATSER